MNRSTTSELFLSTFRKHTRGEAARTGRYTEGRREGHYWVGEERAKRREKRVRSRRGKRRKDEQREGRREGGRRQEDHSAGR